MNNIYCNLDIYQKEAVMSNYKNNIIIAAPGSGKTTVIINRIFYLIHTLKVNPSNIIVITFTRAAAMNMKSRYILMEKKYNKSNNRYPFFGTFHGLFYKILKNFYKDIQIISVTTSYKLIRNVLSTYIDEVNEDRIREVLNNISLFKNSENSIENFIPTLDKDIFGKCLSNYEEYKKKFKLLDFDDLQLMCKQVFLNNANVLKKYSKLFKHMLVDEFQDCDKIQIQILKMLNINNSVFAVGDEDQCIYGFRGARPDCMVNFQNIFESSEKIYLKNNYRNPKNLISLSNDLIKNNKMRNTKNILPYKNKDGKIKLISSQNEYEQAEQVCNIIKKMITEEQFNLRDFAILYRTNIESRSLIDQFIKEKVPFKLLDSYYNFFNHFICKDIIAYLKLSINNLDVESFCRIINRPFRYISKNNINKIKNNKYKEDPFDLLMAFENIPPFQIKNIEKLKKDINFLNKISLDNAVETIINDLGYYEYLKKISIKNKIDIKELEDVLEEFRNSIKGYNTIIEFIIHVNTVNEEIKNMKKDKKVEDNVTFSTIHGVKGMEFKNVFIINCNEENIPHINSIDNNVEEERRLFYVGITRTIENICLSICYKIKGSLKDPSRFLNECNLIKNNKNVLELFKVGDKVIHKTYGKGNISDIKDNYIKIMFEDSLERTFKQEIIINNNLVKKVI